MNRLLGILLACLLLLTSCGQLMSLIPSWEEDGSASHSRDDRDNKDDRDDKDDREDSDHSSGFLFNGEDADSSQMSPEEDEGPLPAINFTHYYTNVEYADILAFDQAGVVVWEYTTPELEAAQLDQVEAIGLVGDNYLFTCGGNVVCLNARTGEERWTNTEFKGAQSHFAIRGDTVFLCGFFGPDLFVFSASTGETIKTIGSLDPDYFWPFALELDGNQIIVSMSGGPEGDLGSENCHPIRVNLDTWTVVPS